MGKRGYPPGRKRTDMPKVPWTEQEDNLLEIFYGKTRTTELARCLGRSPGSVYARAFQLGLKKSEEYMKATHGQHLIELVRAGVSKPFKKGESPYIGARPIGSERINSYGFLERKIAETDNKRANWRLVHQLVWEQHFGPIPEGHAVLFKDGNKRNITIDNLECISKADRMRRYSIVNWPAPLAEIVRLQAAIKRTINKRSGK